jgi:hypothetical protein
LGSSSQPPKKKKRLKKIKVNSEKKLQTQRSMNHDLEVVPSKCNLPQIESRVKMDVFGEIPPQTTSHAKTAGAVKRKNLRKIISEVHNEIVHNTTGAPVISTGGAKKKSKKQSSHWRFAYDMYCREIMINHAVHGLDPLTSARSQSTTSRHHRSKKDQ